MVKFLNKVLGVFKWMWQRPEVHEVLTEMQRKAWEDLREISFQAIAEVKAGEFTSGEEKRKAAYDRIWAYSMNKGKAYPKSVINWTIEHAYARFTPNV